MHKVKITVLKRAVNEDIVNQVVAKEQRDVDRFPCPRFQDGQEFVADSLFVPPEGFCAWAWADIGRMMMYVGGGGDLQPWYKDKGTVVVCCTDGLRPAAGIPSGRRPGRSVHGRSIDSANGIGRGDQPDLGFSDHRPPTDQPGGRSSLFAHKGSR